MVAQKREVAWSRACELAKRAQKKGADPVELPSPARTIRGEWMVWVEVIGINLDVGKAVKLPGPVMPVAA